MQKMSYQGNRYLSFPSIALIIKHLQYVDYNVAEYFCYEINIIDLRESNIPENS